ncbi:GNAT family N-acetyltransferase [Mycolicibacterium goodii]|uniref:GNAT family N-acetyltransferase n=1 Tax=Mycolicibacterium goodii TaxID=134601 RepID=UPI00256F3CBE|nr:GNAT family N-acetyltransferase [Mycolicibacterium goodii]
MTLELVDHRAPPREEFLDPVPVFGGLRAPGLVGERRRGGRRPVARRGVGGWRPSDPGAARRARGRQPGVCGRAAIDTNDLLEIENIEGRTAARRRKIATRVVQPFAEREPGCRLMAYSKGAGADDFWASLGWEPFYDSRRGPAGRTLFIQPADW